MRIVHVNYDFGQTGGATIAAVRLHNALLGQSVDSLFLCRSRNGDGASVLEYPSTLAGKASLVVKRKLSDALQRLLIGRAFPINVVSSGLPNHLNSLAPDIVHLHWVKLDTIAIEEIPRIRQPVVLSLHDLWPCLGTNSYPERGDLNTLHRESGRAQWLHDWTFHRKVRSFRGMRLCVVAASEWCAGEARRSEAFRNHRVECIPHCVDVDCFSPGDAKAARQRMGLPRDKVVVAYGANMGTKWPIKGFDRLVSAIKALPPHVERRLHIAVFGEEAGNSLIGQCTVQFLGRQSSADAMAAIYRAADVFAFPSRQETFGQTKAEALACGIPVVAFDETACGEEISHEQTGWVAPPDDIAGFAQGLQWAVGLVDTPERRMQVRQAARNHAVLRFSSGVVASAWVRLYTSLLSASPARQAAS